jgi:hypothetical protein
MLYFFAGPQNFVLFFNLQKRAEKRAKRWLPHFRADLTCFIYQCLSYFCPSKY